jgi:salicylate hydroxylase
MAPSQSYEVLIVGGGLGGVTAALALRRKGLRVTVVESAAELGEVGAGIQTAPNASQILIDLGLRRQLEEIHTQPEDQVRRRWQDGKIIGLTPLGKHVQNAFNGPYWHYHRADLHRVIFEACVDPAGAGPVVRIHTNTRIASMDTANPARPAAVAADGRRFDADVVIGADGYRSQVRNAMGFEDTLEFSGEMAFRTLVPGKRIIDDPATRFLVDRLQSTIWYGPDRHFVHYIIRQGEQLNLVGLVPCTDDVRDNGPRTVSAEYMASCFPGWDDRAISMIMKADDDILLQALYYRRRDPVWVDGHVALLGDACHAMLPYQAQGASQAMEDGAVLADELGAVTRSGIDDALVRYAARRSTPAGMVQDASLQNKTFYHLPDGPEQQERDRKLAEFSGESHLPYEWIWAGTHLRETDSVRFGYQFAG